MKTQKPFTEFGREKTESKGKHCERKESLERNVEPQRKLRAILSEYLNRPKVSRSLPISPMPSLKKNKS
jgi:hypothetical protein